MFTLKVFNTRIVIKISSNCVCYDASFQSSFLLSLSIYIILKNSIDWSHTVTCSSVTLHWQTDELTKEKRPPSLSLCSVVQHRCHWIMQIFIPHFQLHSVWSPWNWEHECETGLSLGNCSIPVPSCPAVVPTLHDHYGDV